MSTAMTFRKPSWSSPDLIDVDLVIAGVEEPWIAAACRSGSEGNVDGAIADAARDLGTLGAEGRDQDRGRLVGQVTAAISR